MSEPGNPKRVLVLGGGFGGLTAAAAIRRYLHEDDTVTVVDESGEHVQGLSLLWIMRGWRDSGTVTVRPRPQSLPGVDLVQAHVQELDLDNQTVQTSTGTLPYDALIIALGARLTPNHVLGLAEAIDDGSVNQFYTSAGALDAHRRLMAMRSGRLAIVVSSMPYKCPAAPWEAAFLAADLLRENGSRDNVDIRIYTPEPQPMPVAGPVLGAAVVDMLNDAKIGHHFATAIERVDGPGRRLFFTNDVTADFDEALFVPPHQAPDPVRAAKFSESGWIPVDPHTLATSVPGVWAVGDNASITLTNGKPLPKAAVFARGQAEAAAAGAARYLGRTVPDITFNGIGHCFLETGGHRAAKGAGNFYADGGPQVELHPPSTETHQEKERDEASWLAEWMPAV